MTTIRTFAGGLVEFAEAFRILWEAQLAAKTREVDKALEVAPESKENARIKQFRERIAAAKAKADKLKQGAEEEPKEPIRARDK